MAPISSATDGSFQVTNAELEANQSLINPPPRLESRATDAPPATPPPAVKALVDKHTSPALLKDWCGSKGSEWVPEGMGKTNYSDACKTHDECYGTPGANKYLCDFSLQEDIALDCAAQGGGLLCKLAAGVYFEFVHHLGGAAYANAQAEAAKAGK